MALQEAIRLAQESNDHVCLQHALTWLYTLSPKHKVLPVFSYKYDIMLIILHSQ